MTRQSFAPTLILLFFRALLVLHSALGDWRPEINGCYMPTLGVIRVVIAPPLAEAYGYEVSAHTWEDSECYYSDSRLVDKSDTQVVYNITGIPKQKEKYTILVIAVDRYGQSIGDYHSSDHPVYVSSDLTPGTPHTLCPPLATKTSISATTTTTISAVTTTATRTTTNVHARSSATPFTPGFFSLFPATKMTRSSSFLSSSSPMMMVSSITQQLPVTTDTTIKDMDNSSVANSTDMDTHHSKFHVEKWIIITLAVIVVLFVIFIGVMLFVGRGCRTRRERRLSVRSRTSQEGTMSETLPQEVEVMPLRTSSSTTHPHHPQHHRQQYYQQQHQQHLHQQQNGCSLLPEAEQDSVCVCEK